MTVLVTGAAGFVGLNIVKELASQEQFVVALARRAPDAASLSFLGDLGQRVTWARGDVRDREALVALAREAGATAVVHAAAVTAPFAVEQADPTTVIDINLGGTVNALEAARLAGARRFVFISSTGVYGAPADPWQPIREDTPLTITNLYTIAKQAAEALCRRYTALFGLSTVVGRLGTAFGPMERATQSRTGMSVIYALAHAAARGETVRVHGAERVRDICYVKDVASAFARLTQAERLRWDIYNVAGDRAYAVREALDILAQALGFAWHETDADEADAVTLPQSVRGQLDMTRLRDDLGWTPHYDLQAGLTDYLAWLRAGHAE